MLTWNIANQRVISSFYASTISFDWVRWNMCWFQSVLSIYERCGEYSRWLMKEHSHFRKYPLNTFIHFGKPSSKDWKSTPPINNWIKSTGIRFKRCHIAAINMPNGNISTCEKFFKERQMQSIWLFVSIPKILLDNF